MNKKFIRKVKQSMAILSIGMGITLGAFEMDADTLPESKVFVSSSPADKQCEEIDGFMFEVSPSEGEEIPETESAESSIKKACDDFLKKSPAAPAAEIERMCHKVAQKFSDINVVVSSVDADSGSVNIAMRLPDHVVVSLNLDEETLAEDLAGVNVYAGDTLVAANVLPLDFLHEYLKQIQG